MQIIAGNRVCWWQLLMADQCKRPSCVYTITNAARHHHRHRHRGLPTAERTSHNFALYVLYADDKVASLTSVTIIRCGEFTDNNL